MKKIKVCLVGLGNIGRVHLDAYLDHKDVQVTVVDTDRSVIKTTKKYSLKYEHDLTNALRSNFDIIDICTPTDLHYQQVEMCIKKTKAIIFCEKPLTVSLNEAEKIFMLAKKRSAPILIAMVERFNDPFIRMRKQLRGINGPFRIYLTRRTKNLVGKSWFTKKMEGNLINDLGIHDIDLSLYLTGEKIIDSSIKHRIKRNIIKIELDLSKGSKIVILLKRDLPKKDIKGVQNVCEIYCKNKKIISYRSSNETLTINSDKIKTVNVKERFPTAYFSEIKAVIGVARGLKENVFPKTSQVLNCTKILENLNIQNVIGAESLYQSPIIKNPPPYKSPLGKDEFKEVVKRMVGKNSELPSSPLGGPSVKEFENKFARYIGTKYAVTTTSGTTALHLALESLGLKKGSEVLIPAMSFIATANTVIQAGLKVKFVDIDETYCLDPVDLMKKMTPNVSAVIVVHLYGHPANMKKILSITKPYKIPIVEDACQSHGATYFGKKTGNLGDIGCFSFYASKNMSTGEGGMVVTNSEKIRNKLLSLKSHGDSNGNNSPYSYDGIGYNYSMTTMQAIIGIVQLKKLNKLNRYRKQMFDEYYKNLLDLPLVLPKVVKNVKSANHLFPVLIPEIIKNKRDRIVEDLKSEGVPLSVAYPAPMYKAPQFLNLGAYCPHAEDISSRMITLFTDTNIPKILVPKIKIAFKKVLNRYLYEKN